MDGTVQFYGPSVITFQDDQKFFPGVLFLSKKLAETKMDEIQDSNPKFSLYITPLSVVVAVLRAWK